MIDFNFGGDLVDIDFSTIKDIFGDDVLCSCSENIVDLISNVTYLKKLGIEDVEYIIERFPLIFLTDSNDFKKRVDALILEHGNVECFSYDVSLWEGLL